MKDFGTLAAMRESCRKFTDKKIAHEDLLKILSVALSAPSAINAQPWKLYAVESKDAVAAVAASFDAGFNKFAAKAPAFVVVEQDIPLKLAAAMKMSGNDFASMDIGEITAYITLAARDLGISSCILGSFSRAAVAKATGANAKNIRIIVALGYSESEIPREKKRALFEEKVVLL